MKYRHGDVFIHKSTRREYWVVGWSCDKNGEWYDLNSDKGLSRRFLGNLSLAELEKDFTYAVTYSGNYKIAFKGKVIEGIDSIDTIITIGKTDCSHDLRDYLGLNEKYKYCTKCDFKENI